MESQPIQPQKNAPPMSNRADRLAEAPWRSTLLRVLQPLASLKLTVVLFALAIFIVFAGTVAQVDQGIDYVVKNYFRCAIAWIDLQIFFPRSIEVRGSFPFPGGWLIGLVMALNLVAAHTLRFRVQAKGPRLRMGLGVLAAGIAMTWLVIASGSNKEGLQGDPLVEWGTLWVLFKGTLAALWLTAAYAYATLDKHRKLERYGLLAVLVSLGALVAWLLLQNEMLLGDSSMRILWQLLKGGLAGLVLLVGCAMVFRRRAGVVLLHAGVGLMMFSELMVGMYAAEGLMSIDEGQTVNFVRNVDAVELAVVDPSDPKVDQHTVVPESRLKAAAESGELISDDQLPFDIEVKEFFDNSKIVRAQPDEQGNPASAGAGLAWRAEPMDTVAGAATDGEVDLASAYIELKDKDSGDSLGTFLVAQILAMNDRTESVAVGSGETKQTYDVSLRFERKYRPYAVTLIDVRKDDYIGTNTPRNYSSDIRLVDPTRAEDREIHIWMNNPLRYAGETFYQSDYRLDPQTGVESTTLQVVSNTGWMIPYVSCMIVATGLLAQFYLSIMRFLRRRSAKGTLYKWSAYASLPLGGAGYGAAILGYLAGRRAESRRVGKRQKKQAEEQVESPSTSPVLWVFPAAVVAIAALWVLGAARTPSAEPGEMDLYAAGTLPLVYEGRLKPLDTLARNSLRIISDKQTFVDANDERQPAMRWLLDVITDRPAAGDHPVFRIENLELQAALGLEPRKRYRYALDEFRGKIGELDKQAKLAHSKPVKELSVYQKKVLQLEKKLRLYYLLHEAFSEPPEPSRAQLATFARIEGRRREEFKKFSLPLSIPPASENEKWIPYTFGYVNAMLGDTSPQTEPTRFYEEMFAAYRADKPVDFNAAVTNYKAWLAGDNKPADLNRSRIDFEAFFNHMAPFYLAAVLYVFAFILSALAWLGWSAPLNRAALWLIIFTLGLHTFALIARIYISGRPPVTNLYSSAVFIGWGVVVMALIFELIYRLGIGNIVAAVAGFATLLIAHFLAGDGDTFVVLQAVLDTQFWLATHVTCITLGYSTTYMAGLLGIIYILRGVFTPTLTPELGKELGRMIYGTVCFALFFSFVGTVLGGLWADDSWGRFWGWDPKENGALIIVLWNALVLHARWDGQVKDRGMAVLSVAGNIAVSWSWFGVNELGAGLHSYGFTEGVTRALVIFVASQLVLISIGSLPKQWWASDKAMAGGENA